MTTTTATLVRRRCMVRDAYYYIQHGVAFPSTAGRCPYCGFCRDGKPVVVEAIITVKENA